MGCVYDCHAPTLAHRRSFPISGRYPPGELISPHGADAAPTEKNRMNTGGETKRAHNFRRNRHRRRQRTRQHAARRRTGSRIPCRGRSPGPFGLQQGKRLRCHPCDMGGTGAQSLGVLPAFQSIISWGWWAIAEIAEQQEKVTQETITVSHDCLNTAVSLSSGRPSTGRFRTKTHARSEHVPASSQCRSTRPPPEREHGGPRTRPLSFRRAPTISRRSAPCWR